MGAFAVGFEGGRTVTSFLSAFFSVGLESAAGVGVGAAGATVAGWDTGLESEAGGGVEAAARSIVLPRALPVTVPEGAGVAGVEAGDGGFFA